MSLRKEQVVLIGTVAVLGLLVWQTMGAYEVRGGSVKRADAPEFVHHPAPDTTLVLPAERKLRDSVRDLFSPPSDTRPLPPLTLIPPPIVPLAQLRPPPVPGPGVALYGRFLRENSAALDVPDLFVEAAEAVDLADVASVTYDNVKPASGTAFTPEQIAARLRSHKKVYDWIRLGDFRFGQIRNPDRYTLAKRPNEDILFVEFNPETGQPRFPGAPPAAIPRKTVNEFDFADNVPNQIEMRRVQFGDPLPASEYDLALTFAAWCIEERLVTPRALVVAEEMYRRASRVLVEDPAPRLGLARVYEAGFQFEKAFTEYKALLDGNLKGNPLVLVSLAGLYERFHMTATAGALLVEAERAGRTSWQVQEAFGRFQLNQGRAADAVAHLRLAIEYEPQGAETKRARTRLRTLYGSALLANGQAAEGRDWIEKALQSDPTDQTAQAALICAKLIAPKSGATDGPLIASPGQGAGESQGFELLLANGLAQMSARDAANARLAKANLVAAAAVDPLRAGLAWRALSYLAEKTKHPEEALRYIELAAENNPLDAWTLYQRGRLLAAKDDLEGAAESFKAALDREIGFVDALAALGALEHRRGNFEAADRYLERALALDPSLSNALALRGVNSLEVGEMRDAEKYFKAVLATDADHPTARNGLAWCFYRRGDSTEALSRLRELDDNRRALPESDLHRVWARGQIDRIVDHLEKVVWTDRFDRASLAYNYGLQENNGPTLSIHDGMVTLAGAFKANGRARLWQVRSASDFVSLEARLTVRTGTTARVGLFVSRETQRGGENTVDAEITATRHNEPGKNTIQTRYMKRGEEDLPYTDVIGFEWKLDTPVVVRIERTGEKESPQIRVLFDGFPVLDGKAIPALGRTTNELRLGVFAEGQVGRVVQVDIDDIEIVQRERGK
ncbi:MAG: tetratricopeptide repeat protein [Planctomycetes bacterium]|nr:tetratricopeptide repeat protein [Planctomycetota bacterium]